MVFLHTIIMCVTDNYVINEWSQKCSVSATQIFRNSIKAKERRLSGNEWRNGSTKQTPNIVWW